jgi:heat shock protein HtpX
MSAVFGLSTWQWNNNVKSIILLLAFPFLLLGIMWGIFFVSGYLNLTPNGRIDPNFLAALGFMGMSAFSGSPAGAPQTPLDLAAWVVWNYWPIVLGIAAVWVLIGYFFNSSMIHAATGAKPVARIDQPKLYNLLENLCISRGMQLPRLYIVDTDVMNAFASGIDDNSFSITITRGLLDQLNDKEVEAVLAHELTHIINRDVRLLIVTIVFTGMLSFLAQMLWRSLRYSSGGRSSSGKGKGNAALLMLVAAIMLGIGYAFAITLRLALSRRREFLADAGSVELTKNPGALILALKKISGNSRIPNVPPEVEQLFIDNPPSLFGLFDTHPPIEERIKVLCAIGGLPPEGKSMIPEAG